MAPMSSHVCKITEAWHGLLVACAVLLRSAFASVFGLVSKSLAVPEG